MTTGKCAGTCLSQSNPCGNLASGVIMQISTFQWHYATFCEAIKKEHVLNSWNIGDHHYTELSLNKIILPF